MLLACSYDALSMSHDPFKAIDGIRSVLKLKGYKATVPDMCLGGGLSEVKNSNGTKCCTMFSEKHAKADVANVEEKLTESGLRLLSKCSSPFSLGCYPNEDATPELDSEGLTIYQEQTGTLRWLIELGRVDVLLEVALLSYYLA